MINNPKNKLQIIISGVLLLLTFVSSAIAFTTKDARTEAFFLNVSAGFFGSFFTFIILGYFERERVKQDKEARFTFYSEQYMLAITKSRSNIRDSRQLMAKTRRLEKYVDQNNLERSIEIIETQVTMIDQLIKYSEQDLDSSQYIASLTDQILTSTFDIGNKYLIENAVSLISNPVKMLDQQ